MPTVMILGGRAPVALDHARRFARQGWTAYVADSVPCRIAGWSRSVAGAVALPPPRHRPREFVAALSAALLKHDVDLLLPTCEEVFYVSRYRDSLPRHVSVATDTFDKLRSLHSKLDFLELARDCGATIPDSEGVASLAAARDWARGRAVVLKPEFSRFGVHVHLYPRGIPGDAPELASLGRWVVQEFCAGEEICSYSVAVKGALTAHVAYRPLYRLSRSSSFYFDPVRVPAIREFVERFVRKIEYTGQISFDWIQNAAGECAVLECNPRAISGVHLFGLQDLLPDAFMGTTVPVVETSSPSARMLTAAMATVGLSAALRAGRLSEWRRDFARASDVLVARGDALPLWGSVRDFGSHVARAWARKCSVREATTRDIEWDGEVLPEC